MNVYDVFADEYIDELDIDPIAPPERYKEITEELLIQNAARWFNESFTNKADGSDDEQETESIPYEEYRIVFDRVMHTLDGKAIQIGLPIQCNMCVLSSDKRLIAMEIDKLFDKLREAVIREVTE